MVGQHQVVAAPDTEHLCLLDKHATMVGSSSTCGRRHHSSHRMLLRYSSLGSSVHYNCISGSRRGISSSLEQSLARHLPELTPTCQVYSSICLPRHKDPFGYNQTEVPTRSRGSSKCDTAISLLGGLHVAQSRTIGSQIERSLRPRHESRR